MPIVIGRTQRILTPRAQDGTLDQFRLSPYFDASVWPVISPENAQAYEGVQFRTLNPTMGTGIAMGIQTSFSDTANVLCIVRNLDSDPNGKFIIMNYIRLINTVAGTSTTSSHVAIVTDTANRFSSGGTDLTGNIKNVHTGFTQASIADVRFGAITAGAAVAKRQISRAVLKTQAAPCWVVGDRVTLNFAGNDPAHGLLSGAAAGSFAVMLGPVILAPGNFHSLLVHMWNVANATTAPSWEVEVAWAEK